jgi:hypothetical protein
MDIGNLFQRVAGFLDNETRTNQHVDTDGLLGKLGGIFRENGYDGPDYSPESDSYNGQRVLPASQDPLGDPADANYNNQSVLPASEDPLGDPADTQPRRW